MCSHPSLVRAASTTEEMYWPPKSIRTFLSTRPFQRVKNSKNRSDVYVLVFSCAVLKALRLIGPIKARNGTGYYWPGVRRPLSVVPFERPDVARQCCCCPLFSTRSKSNLSDAASDHLLRVLLGLYSVQEHVRQLVLRADILSERMHTACQFMSLLLRIQAHHSSFSCWYPYSGPEIQASILISLRCWINSLADIPRPPYHPTPPSMNHFIVKNALQFLLVPVRGDTRINDMS